MEITLEAIIGIISLLLGGTGVGGFLFWRQHKRKEEAEAKLGAVTGGMNLPGMF